MQGKFHHQFHISSSFDSTFISTLNFVFDTWCCSIEMISSVKITQKFPIRIISVQSFCLGVTPTCDGFLFKLTSINNQSNSGKTRFESWMDDFLGEKSQSVTRI